MTPLRTLAAALAATLTLAAPLAAENTIAIKVTDPYARASSPMAKSGAVFMIILNQSQADDRLIAASAPVAERVELHTHIEDSNGVMRMIEVEDGFSVPSGGEHALKRGGDHVMLMGLTESLDDGESFPLTLVFEQAGEIVIDVPVDLTRTPEHGSMHN
ncbi:MAG: copper chaperone PCu(A)C [Rhodobacteraceae bacterium]|nr:copper chaperone PCu(A)C [Paracoccaceae bacterium]